MNRAIFFGLLSALLLFALGQGFWQYAKRWPYYNGAEVGKSFYTEDDPIFKMDTEIYKNVPDKDRFRVWFEKLRELETPRKKYEDRALGLMGLGASLGIALGGWALYRRLKAKGRKRFFFGAWFLSWAVIWPGDFCYYLYRFSRRDYPTWGDSLSIPLFNSLIVVIGGYFLTLGLLSLLLRQREFPERMRWIRPASPRAWRRFSFFVMWAGFLFFLAYGEFYNGNPGWLAGLIWG
ncbi:MAG TPA: hypothetical protein VIM58_04425, partial [Candidatus Methylacidiphilales bacterium]